MGMRHRIRRTVEESAMPIGEAFKEFITEKEARNLSKSTLRNYSQSYEYFVDFHELDEDTPLTEIKPAHFYKWMNTLKLDGVKHTSINHYLRDSRAFFYWCMERSYMESFKIEMMEGQEEAPKMFTDEELELLLVKPKANDSFTDWRTWAIVNWVLGTGNRAATICDITVDNVDYKHNEITLTHTKNKKAQIIPLSPALATVLKEYTRKFGLENEDWLFPNIGAEKLTTNALAHSFGRYCKDRGVERTNIHGLRHNFAKISVGNGLHPMKLQRMLGHSSIAMSQHYVKLYSEDLKEDFESYSPLDTIKKGSKRTNKIQRKY